jgi:hypothetical protein
MIPDFAGRINQESAFLETNQNESSERNRGDIPRAPEIVSGDFPWSIDKASWIFYILNKEGCLQIRLDKASFCFLRKRTYALLVYSQNDVLSFQGKEVRNREERKKQSWGRYLI